MSLLRRFWLTFAAIYTISALPAQAAPNSELAAQAALRKRFQAEWDASAPPPEAYLREGDRALARAKGYDRICILSEKAGALSHLPTEQCVRMSAARRFRGVWIDAFEGSRFYPGATARPNEKRIDWNAPDARMQVEQRRRASIWLDTEHVRLPHGFATGGRHGRAVLLEFVGRQTLFAGHYGHLGMSTHEIVVDWLISAKPLD